LAKDGVNIVFEHSVNNIRKNAFHISFFSNFRNLKKHFAQVRFSFEMVVKVARPSPILFPLADIFKPTLWQ
jgi:hypothetical protein